MSVSQQKNLEIQSDHHRRMALNHERLNKTRKLSEVELHDRESYEFMAKLLALKGTHGLVLDLGCAAAPAFAFLNEINLEYVGIDLYLPILRRVKGKRIVLGTMDFLPFKSNSFNAIYARHILEHSRSINALLKEVKRVLKPSGKLVTVIPHYFPDPEPAHHTQLNQSQWHDLLVKFGFNIAFEKIIQRNCPELTILVYVD